MLVVETAAAHPDTRVGALVVVARPGDTVLARDVTVVAGGDDGSSSFACANVALGGSVYLGRYQDGTVGSSGLTGDSHQQQ